MKRFYLATIIAIVITTSIASHLFAVGVRGSTTPRFPAGLRSWGSELFRRLGSCFDGWVACMLARRERQATIFALRHLSDRELKDIGIYRGGAARDPRVSGRGWQTETGKKTPAIHAANVRL